MVLTMRLYGTQTGHCKSACVSECVRRVLPDKTPNWNRSGVVVLGRKTRAVLKCGSVLWIWSGNDDDNI